MTLQSSPGPVVWSERLGLAAAGLGGVREALVWNERVALDGESLAVAFTVATPFVIVTLVLLVTRRRSRIALALLAALIALAWLTTAKLGLIDGRIAFTVGAASLLLQTAGFILMLLPQSWRWLRGWHHG